MSNTRLQQLEDLLDGRRLSDEQVLKILKLIQSYVLQNQQKTEQTLAAIQKMLAEHMRMMKESNDSTLSEMKGKVDHVFVGERLSAMEKTVNDAVSKRLSSLKDGMNGRDGKNGMDGRHGRDGKDGKSPSKDELLSLITPLVDELKKDINKKLSAIPRGQRFGAMGPSVIQKYLYNITPTGDVDGANVTFRLPKAPATNGERVYLNGVRMRSGSGNDYTIAGNVITMATAPLSGDILLVDIDY